MRLTIRLLLVGKQPGSHDKELRTAWCLSLLEFAQRAWSPLITILANIAVPNTDKRQPCYRKERQVLFLSPSWAKTTKLIGKKCKQSQHASYCNSFSTFFFSFDIVCCCNNMACFSFRFEASFTAERSQFRQLFLHLYSRHVVETLIYLK